jgi:hypothetical protein
MEYYTKNEMNNDYDFEKTQTFYKSAYDTMNTKLRDVDKTKQLVLSNIYSYKKNKAHNKLLLFIIIICIILIIITNFKKIYQYPDDIVYGFIIGSIVGLACIYIGYSLWDFSFRNNQNYDEYDYSKFGTINEKTPLNYVKPNKNYIATIDTSNCIVSPMKESDKTISAFFKSL